ALASKATRYDVAELRDIAYVSRNVAASLRNDALSWSHHKAVASLDDPDEQRRFLTLAAKEGWIVSELRDAIKRKQLAEGEYGPVFTKEQVIAKAFRYFREVRGFPYPNLPPHMCLQEINKLAETLPDKLQHTNVAYKVADTYHPHRFHAKAIG